MITLVSVPRALHTRGDAYVRLRKPVQRGDGAESTALQYAGLSCPRVPSYERRHRVRPD